MYMYICCVSLVPRLSPSAHIVLCMGQRSYVELYARRRESLGTRLMFRGVSMLLGWVPFFLFFTLSIHYLLVCYTHVYSCTCMSCTFPVLKAGHSVSY